MTSNQLQYWRNVETERANRANEANEYIKALANQLQASVAERNLANSSKQAAAQYLQALTAQSNLRNLDKQAEAAMIQANVNRSNLSNLTTQANAARRQADVAYSNYLLNYALNPYKIGELQSEVGLNLAQTNKTIGSTGTEWVNSIGNILKGIAAFI